MLLRGFRPRLVPSGLIARYVAVILLVGLGITYIVYSWPATPRTYVPSSTGPRLRDAEHIPPSITYGGVQSPIRDLMVNASARFDHLLAQRTRDMWAASSRYRIRRGRHPPPGFDKWVEAATESNSVIVEEFFDRIYKDLTPFWGLDPKVLRLQAKSLPWVVSVRNGGVITYEASKNHPHCLEDWADLVREFSKHLPDLDMPLNLANEARLLVPFEEVDRLVRAESKKRKLTPLAQVTHDSMSLSADDKKKTKPLVPNWISSERNHWDVVLRTCDPSSPVSNVKQGASTASHNNVPLDWRPGYAFEGFVKNWTAATDPCEQPHIQHVHRVFTKPRAVPVTDELIPLFSGSKLSRNNDILLPGAIYLSSEESLMASESLREPWAAKNQKVFWRGQADRLAKMLDGELISQLENANEPNETLKLPPKDLYISERRKKRALGSWLSSIVDVSTDQKEAPLSSQLANRFLPDVDGAAVSLRFRSLLRSTSLPLKSTLFTEWHDDRLVPWVHFVPLDSTLQDLHAVLEFFADGSSAGDAAARFIAERGSEWADRVLRREDMKLYVWRLLLEWARVVDDNRETLAFTGDVMEHPG